MYTVQPSRVQPFSMVHAVYCMYTLYNIKHACMAMTMVHGRTMDMELSSMEEPISMELARVVRLCLSIHLWTSLGPLPEAEPSGPLTAHHLPTRLAGGGAMAHAHALSYIRNLQTVAVGGGEHMLVRAYGKDSRQTFLAFHS